jgi:hypothetical protein
MRINTLEIAILIFLILVLLRQTTIIRKEKMIMGTLKELADDVAALTTVEKSAIALLDGLSQQLKDALAQNDPAAIQQVIDNIDAGKQELAAAITRNTV